VSSQVTSLPRRTLNARQVETVERLFAAAQELLDEVGHDEVTIRLIAARAGLSAATAYSYFASKEHLFAELFWRMLVETPMPEQETGTSTERLQETAADLAQRIADHPALAAAASQSLLGSDPEVQRIRLTIGQWWVERFREVLGEDADPDLLLTLAFAFSGALLNAGMGISSYQELVDQVRTVVAVITRGYE
jgi:AcrR family transcriptional regulator